MEKRNVAGIRALKFAVVEKESNVVISVHSRANDANGYLAIVNQNQEFEVVELQDGISYIQR